MSEITEYFVRMIDSKNTKKEIEDGVVSFISGNLLRNQNYDLEIKEVYLACLDLSPEILYLFVSKLLEIIFSYKVTYTLNRYTKTLEYILKRLAIDEEQNIINRIDRLYILLACYVLVQNNLSLDEKIKSMCAPNLFRQFKISPEIYLAKIKRHKVSDVISILNSIILAEMYLYGLLKEVSENSTAIEKSLIDRKSKDLFDDNSMYMLKGFNSVYPAIGEKDEVGGGFFIKWKGVGIVVDPGFDFVKNMLLSNIFIEQIDLIFITHAHDDHCRDVPLIYSLLNKYNKLNRQSKQIHMIATDITCRMYQYIDSGVGERTVIKINDELDSIWLNNWLISKNIPVRVNFAKAKHHELPFAEMARSICLSLNIELLENVDSLAEDIQDPKISVLFTGDTGYDEEVIKKYKSFSPNIIVFNIGVIETTFNKFHRYHLGLKGSAILINEITASNKLIKVFIASEYGLEMKPFRLKIIDIIRGICAVETSGTDASKLAIIPCALGHKINLDKMELTDQNGISCSVYDCKYKYLADKIVLDLINKK